MADSTSSWALLLVATIVGSFALLCLLVWFGWRFTQRPHSVSPYTGLPLRRASELSYYSAEKIAHYLLELSQYDNRPFKLNRAALCRETGRIFQNCVTWYDIIDVDWHFLHKRYPGSYVSWGSLSKELREVILQSHGSLEGFQTEVSSSQPSARAIEPEYAYAKPGPLYVDPETKILLGWKLVPGTHLEVLIVQKPTK